MTTTLAQENSAKGGYIERQPVLDRQGNTLGYELRYHSSTTPQPLPESDFDACANLLAYILGETGWLPEGKRVFINADMALLQDADFLSLLPNGRLVLNLHRVPLQTSEELLAACDVLKTRDIGIAFDWCAEVKNNPEFLVRADYILLDAQNNNFYTLHDAFNQLALYPARKIAKRINDAAEYRLCAQRGFDLFQGYFFTRPEVIAEKEANTSLAQLVQLFELVGNNAESREIEETLKRDPALVVKLLGYINSAGMSVGHKVTSIAHAIRMLGYKQLYRWVALLLYTAGDKAAPAALMKTVLARSRFIELLGRAVLPKHEQDNLFMMGMLSMLDVVFGVPLEQALAKLPLPESLVLAVTQYQGTQGLLLRLAQAAEGRDMEMLVDITTQLGLAMNDVNRLQLEAVGWSESLSLS